MGIKPKTHKLLKRLASEVVKELEHREVVGGRWGTIPTTLLPSGTGEPPSAGTASLFLTMDETELYQECLHALIGEPELEHLLLERKVERKIDDQLWELVCDLFLNRQQYKDSGKRNERIEHFVSEVTKSPDDYEVLFVIDHLRMDEGQFVVGNVTFFHLNDQQALERGMHHDLLAASMVGKTVGQVHVQAGSSKTARDRAKEKVDTALSVLRVSGAPIPLVHDDQLLQSRSQFYAVKNLSRSDERTSGGWERGFVPATLELRGATLEVFSEELVQLQPIVNGAISGDLGERLLRALEWVSSSITHERNDDKVVSLCTSLETLLTTINDKQKGEAVALRFLLLSMAVDRDGLLLHPLEVLHLYKLRSKVVHGSRRNVCGKRDYQLLRHVVLDVMQDVISLSASNQELTKASKLITELQRESRVQRAITWLQETSVADTKELKHLLEYADEWLKVSRT